VGTDIKERITDMIMAEVTSPMEDLATMSHSIESTQKETVNLMKTHSALIVLPSLRMEESFKTKDVLKENFPTTEVVEIIDMGIEVIPVTIQAEEINKVATIVDRATVTIASPSIEVTLTDRAGVEASRKVRCLRCSNSTC
jgi:ribosomal protein S4E